MKKVWGNNRGFTLIEIVVSMLIITIALVPMMDMFYSSRDNYGRATETTIALNLAQGKMEELLGQNPVHISANSTSWLDFPYSGDYTYQVNVSEADLTLKLYQIDVRVRYQVAGKEQQISLSAYATGE
ncbi:MAG: type IV pilus modification PilV family protein [Bacillota bacterium]